MKKKLLLLMTMLLILVFGQTLAVSAEEGEAIAEEERIYPSILQDPSQYEVLDSDAPQTRAAVEFEEYDETELFFTLEEKIKEALLAGESSIDIADMKIEPGKYQIGQLVYFSPYLCEGIDVKFGYYPSGAYSEIRLEKPDTLDVEAHIQKIDQAVAEILGQVSDNMADDEKALMVHEYFVSQYEYDYDNYLANTIPDDSYRSGGLFVNKTGVCQAYAYGYKYIMNMLGLECHVTSSDSMNHAWNIIKIDGAYYHVDCTWDDPVEDRLGLVYHKYFLVSDDAIENVRPTKHTGWNLKGTLSCNSTEFDNDYWLDVTSPIIIGDDAVFYVRYDSEKKTSYLYKGNDVIKDLGKWNAWKSNSFYTDAFSGLFMHEEQIYYNTSTEIRKIGVDGQEDTLVHTPNELSQGYVYGLRKNGTQIEYSIKQTPNEKQTDANMFTVPINFNPEVTGILLNKKALQLTEGETFTFEYTLSPDGVESKVTWSTSDGSVAGVDDKGIMTARKPGNAMITATTENGKSAKCEVTVTRKPVQITKISLNKTKLTLEAGKSETLAATITPSDTTESKGVQWSSDNEGVAKVTSGEVTAVSAGTATITATASNGMTATCVVTVTGSGSGNQVPITGVSLDKSEASLVEGSSITLTATIEPADTTDNKELKWSTSNEGVAKVEDGVVTGVTAGEATITVTTSNGKSAACKVMVTKKAPDAQLPFVDVDSGSWFIEPVEFVYKRGIMTGLDTNHFGPSVEVSRAQMAVILHRLEGEPAVGYNSTAFKDVADGMFYTNAAMWAKETGVIAGYDNGNFGPADNITREQMSVILFRYAQYKGFDTTAIDNLSKFPDRNKVSNFAKEGISWAVGIGLITGDQGNISPQGNAERAQAAAILQRFMTKYGE